MAFTPASKYRPGAPVLLLAAALTLGTQQAAADNCPRPIDEPHILDWVPLSQLSEEEQAAIPGGCCGAYVAPARSDADADLDPERAPLRASAQRVEGVRHVTVLLEGDAQVTQGHRSASADRVYLNQSDNRLEMSGDIVIREPGLLLRAEHATLNTDTGAASLDDAQFVLYETRVRGGAKRLERLSERRVISEDGHFTTCEPHDNFWTVRGARLLLDGDRHYGEARHARLTIKDVPVLYTPYVRFPVGDERLTGFLMPSFSGGTQSRNGMQLTLPFYWNIAPNADMTLSPRHMTKRGTLLEGETRHLSRNFRTELNGAFIANDQGGRHRRLEREIAQGLITEEEAYPFRGEDRWMVQLRQTGGEDQRWSSHFDYTELSDRQYVRDIGGFSLEERRQARIENRGHLSYRSDHWYSAVSAEEILFLSVFQKPYRELPRINLDGQYRWQHWQLNLNNEWVHFDLNRHFDQEPLRSTLVTGSRARTDYQLVWDYETEAGFIKPGVGLRTLGYRLDDSRLVADADSTLFLHANTATLDAGLNFDRYSDGGWRQSLEPRLLYFYSARADHSDLFDTTLNGRPVNFDTTELPFTYDNVFRTTRFSGGDRLDDANQLAAGLTGRLTHPDTGIEHLRVSLGQIHYFTDREVGLTAAAEDPAYDTGTHPRSELAAHMSGQLNRSLQFVGNITYNHRDDSVSRGNVRLRYLDERYRIFNIAYTYTSRPEATHPLFPGQTVGRNLDQLDASLVWPVAGSWSLIARGNYDFNYRRELDSFAGLEYSDCCYRLRVIARRWLDFDYTPDFLDTATNEDYDEGIFLELELRGLGSIADRISELLRREIAGFDTRQQNLR